MAFDLVTARARIGIADSSKDTILTSAMNAALAIAEKFCDRKFMFSPATAEFFDVWDDKVQLPQYPIGTVTQITGTDASYRVHQELGMIMFNGNVHSKYINVKYTGGFKPLPADLELALWAIFDDTYGEFSGSGSIGGLNGLSRITVSGVGTIAYGTNSSSSAGGGGAFAGLIPIRALNILQMYRREYV